MRTQTMVGCTVRRAGFSLIEFMIVMTIIAIFASMALPSYRFAIGKVRRAEGRAALLQLMHQQEAIYTQRIRYVEFSAATLVPGQPQFKWYSGATPASSAYEIDASACPGQLLSECIELKARPGTALVNTSHIDGQCGTLRLDSFGRRSANAADCW